MPKEDLKTEQLYNKLLKLSKEGFNKDEFIEITDIENFYAKFDVSYIPELIKRLKELMSFKVGEDTFDTEADFKKQKLKTIADKFVTNYKPARYFTRQDFERTYTNGTALFQLSPEGRENLDRIINSPTEKERKTRYISLIRFFENEFNRSIQHYHIDELIKTNKIVL